MNEWKIAIKQKNMMQLAEYRKKLRRNPKLAYLFIELTDACNLSCLHCGSSCNEKQRNHIDAELLKDALRKLAEDVDPGKVMVCITGGEPLLHPDFFGIVREITALGFPWGMTTNATLIDKNVALRLKECAMRTVSVSLDGLEESHDWLRDRKGCFQKTVSGIKNLKEAGLRVQATTVIHKRNFHELEGIFQLVRELELPSWRVINVEPMGRALQNDFLLLDHGEMKELLDFIREKRYSKDTPFDVCFGCSHYLSYDYEREVRDNYFICGAGLYVGSILWNGDVFSCLDIERRPELIQGNIAKDRFYDVWKNRFSEFRIDRGELATQCRECSERYFCSGDSMHTWDFEKKEPRFCILRGGNGL